MIGSFEVVSSVGLQLPDVELARSTTVRRCFKCDYYRPCPVVLARMSRLDREALRDLLSVSWRLADEKANKRDRSRKEDNT